MSVRARINGVHLSDFADEDVLEYARCLGACAYLRVDPSELLHVMADLDRQDWFDRLKCEAKRLGVRV
jgi:hypothetical protein